MIIRSICSSGLKKFFYHIEVSKSLAWFLFALFFLFTGLLSGQPQEIHSDGTPARSSGSYRAMRAASSGFPNDRMAGKQNPGASSRLKTLGPALFHTIEGINFNEDGANTGFLHIPPDPHGATGPAHLVSVVNVSIEWHTKSGTQEHSENLESFFSSLSPLSSFDPKVIYDQYNDRFVVVVLDQTAVAGGDPANTSRILLAVSDDSDPNGTWFFEEIDSKISISSVDHWADYPGLAVDNSAIYVTNNMFTFGSNTFGGSRLWIIAKSPFYSGGSVSFTIHDPSTEASLPGNAFTLQPAHMFGASPGSVGTFLVNSGWVSGVTDFLSIIQVEDPLGTPSFSNQFLSLGNITSSFSLPDAPQSGTGTLVETNDGRMLHVVWRADELWGTMTVDPQIGTDANEATAHWYRIDTSNLASLSLLDQGDVGGEDIAAGTFTFFPSIAVNSNGDMAIGFAASAPSIFPGAYYTGRLAGDPAGTVQSSETLAAGLNSYVRTFGGGRNRWGDYSAISVDPLDDETFWVFNEYALEHGTPLLGEDGRWGTRWGRFTFSPAQFSPGDIIISEIMQDPDIVPDTDGEWFELFNATTSDINLNGWRIRDNGSDNHIINNAGPLVIPALNFLILGINSNSAENGNYTTDYQYSNFELENGVDEVILEEPDVSGFMIIDEVDYDGGASFPNPTGASMALTNFQSDNNAGSNWTTATSREPGYVGTTGDLGSPGTLGSDQVLPVSLVSFTATAEEGRITLAWETESEVLNLGFEVLRSTELEGLYITLSSYESNRDLEGKFNSNTLNIYRYSDELVLNGQSYWYKLVDVDVFGIRTEHGPIAATPGVSGLTTDGTIPDRFQLLPNYPNPFNPRTTLRIGIPEMEAPLARVELIIYNALGQPVKKLYEGSLPPGTHQLIWRGDSNNGNPVPSGIYYAAMKAKHVYRTIKLVLLK